MQFTRETIKTEERVGRPVLQVVLHSKWLKKNRFNLDEVATAIADKLVNRHPHVFGENRLPNSEAVLRQSEVIKRSEKHERRSVLEVCLKGCPRSRAPKKYRQSGKGRV